MLRTLVVGINGNVMGALMEAVVKADGAWAYRDATKPSSARSFLW